MGSFSSTICTGAGTLATGGAIWCCCCSGNWGCGWGWCGCCVGGGNGWCSESRQKKNSIKKKKNE